MIRFAHTQVWPALRNFEAIAPATAASRSASSNTMNGALPPSSRAIRLTVPALLAISSLPTAVEPVKLSTRTAGCAVSTSPISSGRPQTTLSTPARHTGPGRQLGQRGRRQRRLLGGFHDHRAAGRQGRRRLAQDHRRREVPGRDGRGDADRLAEGQQPPARDVGRDHLAVGALGLFRVPLDKACPVEDLAAGLGQRLALLGGQDAWPDRRRWRRSGRTSGA